MRIENSFDVPLPIDEAWAVLTDIPRIAPCMPGAELTDVVEERSYKGKVAVRLGPVALSFKGTARFEELDRENHRARVKASGTDSKGRGGAQADVSFELRAKDAVTEVLILTDLQLSGSVAQYGRGSGMISDLSSHLVSEFADCLKQQLDRSSGDRAAEGADEVRTEEPRAAEPVSGIGLGIHLIWNALLRKLKQLFGRG